MFDSTPTPSTDSSERDLHRTFMDDPDLFPEITDPKEREEAVLGFEQYLRVINDILMYGKLDHITEEDILREEWQKRFRKPVEHTAKQ